MDRDAWQELLVTGKLAGAGLDVYWEEPPDPISGGKPVAADALVVLQ